MNDIATAEQEPYKVRLTPAEFVATQAKIEKINERAAKRGFTGRFEVKGERVEKTETNLFGLTVTKVFYESTITGETPRYNGWKFLARVDAIGDTFTLAVAPGVEHVDRDLVRPGHCDHCESNRFRKNTYLVQAEDGEIRNVGSTCIKDFLGWQGNFAFISEGDVERDVFGAGHGGGEHSYNVETILAASHAAIRTFGWVSAQGYGQSTADVVRLLIGVYRPTKHDEEMLAQVRPYVEEAKQRAEIVKAWILSDDFNGKSTYVDNLKVAASLAEVTSRQIGILASAPQAYIRHLETAAEREAREARWAAEKASKKVSDYIGSEGDKVEIEGEISAIRYIEGDYGTTTLYTIVTADGNLVKWFASRSALGENEGVQVRIKGTVKKHDDYQGVKSTVLTRCKAL